MHIEHRHLSLYRKGSLHKLLIPVKLFMKLYPVCSMQKVSSRAAEAELPELVAIGSDVLAFCSESVCML